MKKLNLAAFPTQAHPAQEKVQMHENAEQFVTSFLCFGATI